MPKKIAVISNDCVACGSCLKICPLAAVSIYYGIRAEVDAGRCVGCGKCAETCPAGVIVIAAREDRCV